MRKLNPYSLIIVLTFLVCCNYPSKKKEKENSRENNSPINYAVLKTYPHDTNSFTEGLFIEKGKIFESTGSPEEIVHTNSLFGEVDTTTGKIIVKVILDKTKHFGEGSTYLNGKIYYLTYRSNLCFVYDAKTYREIGKFVFSNKEGWGLTTDGNFLIMSDGTNKLTFISPEDYIVHKVLIVQDENSETNNINELEFINGFIYANIFMTNKIIKIDAITGEVKGQLDLSSLCLEAKAKHKGSLELNGIAYDTRSKTMLVTGKLWPNMYKLYFTH